MVIFTGADRACVPFTVIVTGSVAANGIAGRALSVLLSSVSLVSSPVPQIALLEPCGEDLSETLTRPLTRLIFTDFYRFFGLSWETSFQEKSTPEASTHSGSGRIEFSSKSATFLTK